MNSFGKDVGVWLTGFFVIAIIAVLVSNQATTSSLISAIGNAMTQIFGAILSPVTGTSTAVNANAASTATPQPLSN
jgi:hypothetical protein